MCGIIDCHKSQGIDSNVTFVNPCTIAGVTMSLRPAQSLTQKTESHQGRKSHASVEIVKIFNVFARQIFSQQRVLALPFRPAPAIEHQDFSKMRKFPGTFIVYTV